MSGLVRLTTEPVADMEEEETPHPEDNAIFQVKALAYRLGLDVMWLNPRQVIAAIWEVAGRREPG